MNRMTSLKYEIGLESEFADPTGVVQGECMNESTPQAFEVRIGACLVGWSKGGAGKLCRDLSDRTACMQD